MSCDYCRKHGLATTACMMCCAKRRHDELASERAAGWQAAKEAIIAALNAMQCEPASEYCGYLVVDMANVMATVRGVK